MSEELCDIWLEMLTHFVAHPNCSIEDLGLKRFLDSAIDMMKHFDELVLGTIEVIDIGIVLKFTELLLDERLFDTIVNNLRDLPKGDARTRQAGLFLLIFEVCEYKKRYYQTYLHQITKDEDYAAYIREQITHHTKLMDKYEKIMLNDFDECTEVIEVCTNTLNMWRSRKS